MKLQAFYWQVGADTHTLIVPSFQSIQEKHADFKAKLHGPLKGAAARHADDVAKELERRLGKEATEYRFFVGVKLPKPEKEKTKLLDEIKFAIKELISGTQQKAGIDGPEVLEDEILRHMRIPGARKSPPSQALESGLYRGCERVGRR